MPMLSEKPATSHGSDEFALWPDRVVALCHAWKAATTGEQDRLLAELWPLLSLAFERYVRLHALSHGGINPEDVEDIASEKSIAFLDALDTGTLDSSFLRPAQVCSYISASARNGLVDWFRARGRARAFATETRWAQPATPAFVSAESNVRHEQFLEAICGCVAQLAPRARLAWFLRAFYDMSSRSIASHPEIRMTPAAVNMLLSRTRASIRECMASKGFDAGDAPTGVFVALWDLLRQGSLGDPRSREPK